MILSRLLPWPTAEQQSCTELHPSPVGQQQPLTHHSAPGRPAGTGSTATPASSIEVLGGDSAAVIVLEGLRDADVGGEGLVEVVGAVRQADQAYMKGHCRSAPGR